MDVEDIPVRGEWAVGSIIAIAIKCLLWLSALGAVVAVALAVRAWPKRRR